MTKKRTLIHKVILVTLFITIVFTFSNCKKSETELAIPNESEVLANGEKTTSTLKASLFTSDGGFGYQFSNVATGGDTNNSPTSSTLRLFEDGVELTKAHSAHNDIRTLGKGRFSHWGSNLYLSASDNSNPKTNGKKYTYTLNGGTPVKVEPVGSEINLTKGTSDGGFAFQINNVVAGGDSNEQPTASKLRIFENGVELNPAHSSHADIRALGKGRYSHWGSSIFISASDNTDPRTNGKKYTYTLDGTAPSEPIITPPPTNNSGVTNPATGPIGFASVNGLTTGGQGGRTITVSTLADFKNAIQSSETMIVQVSGNIKSSGATLLYVQSNKSIIGLKGSSIEGIALSIYGKNNVIIRNLTSKNSLTYSNIIIKEGSHHVWIDHCDLSSTLIANDWGDTYDGLLDVGNGSDFVTISWNKIHDSHIPVLIGFDDNDKGDAGKLNVTMYNNYFYNTNERQPSVRFGKVHVFNNYINNNQGGYAMGSRCGAIIRTDNNVIENSNAPLRTEISAVAGYFSGINTNIYKNCGSSKITTAESTWIPSYEYKSVLIPAANVQATVTASAGATL
ncbi:MAG: pectate lyase [Flavobacterium sp.]|nr:MAG: pectate lyase [Flavobacterium sp.]